MDELERLGITDERANNVLSKAKRLNRLRGWSEYINGNRISVPVRETRQTESNGDSDIMEIDRAAFSILIIAALIVLEIIF